MVVVVVVAVNQIEEEVVVVVVVVNQIEEVVAVVVVAEVVEMVGEEEGVQ